MPEPEPRETIPDGRSASATDAVGQPSGEEVVGDYELISELAAGGMGIVYRARQRSLNRNVALKMLLPGRLTSEVGRARFRAEAEATAELDHPNIVPIFEVGEHAGRPYFSMKLLEGGTLADLLRRSPRPSLHHLVTVVAKVCRAVHYAHQRGILHRDLKPGNVLIDAAGEPFVADFGLAKRLGTDEGLTVTGALLGTPAYMAPEQAGETSHGVTTLTDVYALGAILYEVLTSRPPFATHDLAVLLGQIRGNAPAAPSTVSKEVPRDLELVCLKCLGKVPTDRYASAGELADELERWLRHEPVRVRAPGLISRVSMWARHNSQAAIRVVFIGTAWGLLGPQLPVTLTAFGNLMRNAGDAVEKFPGATQPRLLRLEWAVPSGALVMLLAVSAVLHLSVGMLTYLATRSRERYSHLGGAAAVGLIAGVLEFALYVGPAAVIAAAVVPTVADLNLLGFGFTSRDPERPASPVIHPQDRLLERYPELTAVPERERGPLLFRKVIVANIVGVYEGLVLGMALTLAYALPVAIGGTLLAATLVRSRGSPRAALVEYVEVSVAVSVGWLNLVILVLDDAWGVQLSLPGLEGWVLPVFVWWVLTAYLLVVPLWVVLRGWEGRDRWRGYGLGLGAVILLDLWTREPGGDVAGLRWVLLVAFAAALVLNSFSWRRRRAHAVAPLASTTTALGPIPTGPEQLDSRTITRSASNGE